MRPAKQNSYVKKLDFRIYILRLPNWKFNKSEVISCDHITLSGTDHVTLENQYSGSISQSPPKEEFLSLQDDILSFEPEKQAMYQQVYRPVYFQLVDVLLHKAQFPSDEEYSCWSSDEKEQFRIYRYDLFPGSIL